MTVISLKRHASRHTLATSQIAGGAMLAERLVDERAVFAPVGDLPSPRVTLSFAWEYLRDRNTPMRAVNDVGVKNLLPLIHGCGTIIELGASGDWYRNMMPAGQAYETSGLDNQDRVLDMTAMDLPDNSVDAFISVFALEHIYDYEAVIRECYRCLKPGGRLLLAVPFLCYYHAAPDDYFRFTDSAMKKLLGKFDILKSYSLGNRGLLMSMCYYEHPYMGSKRSAFGRFLLRLASLPFLLLGIAGNQEDRVYAMSQVYLCEKPT